MISEKITSIVIDDDTAIVQYVCDFLKMNGISVLAKGFNGKDAVELYKKFNPTIIFLDIMMPDYDGFYALTEIRKINSNAKIIMVTADTTSKTAHKLENLSSTAVVYKPFDFTDIMETLEKLIKSDTIHNMAFHGVSMSFP